MICGESLRKVETDLRLKRIEHIMIASTASAGALSFALVVWGMMARSAAMVVWGIFAGARTVAGLSVLLGVRFSGRKTDTFPYGLYKLENMVTVVLGAFIIISAVELGRYAVGRIGSQSGLEMGYSAPILLLFAGIVLSLVFGIVKTRMGRKEKSPALLADARLSFVDLAAMIIIAAGVALNEVGLHNADLYSALVVAAMAVILGGKIALEGVKVLLDASLEKDLLMRVRDIADADPGVETVISVDGRSSGSYCFVHLVVVPAGYDLELSEQVSERIKGKISDLVENVDEVVLEFAARAAGTLVAATPLTHDDRPADDIADTAGMALYAVRVPDGTILHKERMAHAGPVEREHAGIYAAVLLAKRGVDTFLLKRKPLAKETALVLDAYGVRVVVSPGVSDLDDAEQEIMRIAAEQAGGTEASESM
jgi:cation diffusion facilitator family transporter